MESGTEKYIGTIEYLGRLYDFCNERFWKGELHKPIITVQQDVRNKALGWWSVKKVWKENAEDEGEHELNITANFLSRSLNEIAATMLHEMCHQYATANKLKDTSRAGVYHNKLFKRIAEMHGLKVATAPTIGWSITDLTEESEKIIFEFEQSNPLEIIYRTPVIKGQALRNSSTRKYVCPVCGNSVRATKAVNIACADCNKLMILED